MKKTVEKFRELSVSKKIQVIAVAISTTALISAIPVYAWFLNQKKAAEMYKVKYPNALFINAAHREDQINFNLDGIDVDNTYMEDLDGNIITDSNNKPIKKNKKYYVFSVSGANTQSYTLQMAHTNNNQFTYKIYDAAQYNYLNSSSAPTGTNSSQIVPSGTNENTIITYKQHANSHTENTLQVINDTYTADDTSTKYYVMSSNTVSGGEYKNVSGAGSYPGILDAGNKYYDSTYGSNTNVDVYAVPSYWQADVTLQSSEIDANRLFCKYYVLEVSWGSEQESQEDKETDLIYFSVDRKS